MRQINYFFIPLFLFSCKLDDSKKHEKSDTTSSIEIRKTQFKTKDTALYEAWTLLKHAATTRNIKLFKQLSLDSIRSADTIVSTSNFITKCFVSVFDSTLIKKFDVAEDIHFMNRDTYATAFSNNILKKAVYIGDVISLKRIAIQKDVTIEGGYWQITFEFLLTKKGYKLFGYNSYGGPICLHKYWDKD